MLALFLLVLLLFAYAAKALQYLMLTFSIIFKHMLKVLAQKLTSFNMISLIFWIMYLEIALQNSSYKISEFISLSFDTKVKSVSNWFIALLETF